MARAGKAPCPQQVAPAPWLARSLPEPGMPTASPGSLHGGAQRAWSIDRHSWSCFLLTVHTDKRWDQVPGRAQTQWQGSQGSPGELGGRINAMAKPLAEEPAS